MGLVSTMRKAEGEQGTFWRFAHATLLIAQVRRGASKAGRASDDDIAPIRLLASEIGNRRPNWWGAPLLEAQIGEILGLDGAAAAAYQRAINLGYSQGAGVRRLIGLLSHLKRFDEIDQVVKRLQDRGFAAEELAHRDGVRRGPQEGLRARARTGPTGHPGQLATVWRPSLTGAHLDGLR